MCFAGLWFLFVFPIQNESLQAKELSEWMSNTTEPIGNDEEYIETKVTMAEGKNGYTLILEEQYFGRKTRQMKMKERRMIPCGGIDDIFIHSDPQLGAERRYFLVIRYRVGKSDIYRFTKTKKTKQDFGQLVAVRVGIYEQDLAHQIKRRLLEFKMHSLKEK